MCDIGIMERIYLLLFWLYNDFFVCHPSFAFYISDHMTFWYYVFYNMIFLDEVSTILYAISIRLCWWGL